MRMDSRKLFKKSDVIVISLIVLIPLTFMLFFYSSKGEYVIIEKDGQVINTVYFKDISGKETFTVGSAEIEITGKAARYINSGCPDKLCVTTGEIIYSEQSAVCLPEKVSIRISGKNNTDGVTY